jgi:hypothetical protein
VATPCRLSPFFCELLHLLKRIRYRWVAQWFSVVVLGETFCFSLERIREAGYLSPVVSTNSQESKMHEFLPLELFSAKTLPFGLANDLPGELLVVPWCLLVVALALPGLSTRMRRDLLEIGFPPRPQPAPISRFRFPYSPEARQTETIRSVHTPPCSGCTQYICVAYRADVEFETTILSQSTQ